jgi:pyruvate,water dikinase
MFELGDAAVKYGQRRVWRLETEIPIKLTVMDLGGALPPEAREKRAVVPEEIDSVPFAALWRGVTHPGLQWAGRRLVSARGFASVLGSAIVGPPDSVRELGATNYLIVGREYLNLNARLAYHFAMVDALVSETAENNYVNLRFRGGGAGMERRDLRARFLAGVLQRSNFGVDQRGDLVTAWLRRYPRETSEDSLALIGRLMACARQLDMVMDDPANVARFVECFLQGDYAAFA